jgi:hypothetical protein
MPDTYTLSFPIEYWAVRLVSGDVMKVLANGFSIENGHYVFFLGFEGKPLVLVPCLVLPESLVLDAWNSPTVGLGD